MKIEYLKFKNINSLKGEWYIDFSSKEFRDSGIFAIVGETGAGKTSILDAITLALYGKTPRQKDITSSKNNIMTKQTAECYSEIVFRGKDNRRYRSRWYQHRAKKSIKGKLQTPKVLLEEVDKKTIATKIEEWREKVVDITKLNFDRFCRCIMLAQGEFSAFLKADEREKSEILEQITNSNIYREIGKRVYQEAKDKKSEIEKLEYLLDIEKPLSDKIRKEYEDSIDRLIRDIKLYTIELSNLRDKKNYIEILNRDTIQIQDIENNIYILKLEKDSITQDKYKIENRLNLAKDKLEEFQTSFTQKQKLISKIEKLDIRIEDRDKDRVKYIDKINELNYKKSIELKKIENIKHIDIKEDRRELYNLKDRYIEMKYICNEYNIKNNKLNSLLNKLNIKKAKYSKVDTELTKNILEVEDIKKELQIMEISKKVLELREYLIEGEPCLVCGSRKHSIDIVDDISTNIDIKSLLLKLDTKIEQRDNLKVDIKTIRGEINSLRDETQGIKLELKYLKDKIDNLEICQNIDNILKEIENKLSILEDIEKRKASLNKIEILEENIENLNLELKNNKNHINQLQKERYRLFKGDIDIYKNNLNIELKNLIEKRDNIQKELQIILDRLKEIEFNILENINKTDNLKENIKNIKEKISNYDLDGIDKKIINLDNNVSSSNQKLGEIKEIIKRDDEVLKRYTKITDKIKDIKDEFEVLSSLNSLIGSRDGAKFAKFAQTVTMDYLILLANRHLNILENRYQIKQDGILNFVIMDRYQADEIRPISTLSGGESFLVSLALALGLSDLARRDINIDTLFLDEGFGTLDNHTLETVLSSLERLQSQGKIIGIISHIEAIKESISLKIEVKKRGGFGYLESKYRV